MVNSGAAGVKPFIYGIEEFFQLEDRRLFPPQIEILAEMKEFDADIDVIMGTHNVPEMTNVAIENYLAREKKDKIHIVVVESSGDRRVFDQILSHPQVSRILLTEDIRVKGKIHGVGSYGMALSSALGARLSHSPFVFFSHSDMIACEDNFLSFLRSKLEGGVRLASFTQRHVIPFTGCMMVRRELLEEKGVDWLPLDGNDVIRGTAMESLIDVVPQIKHVDCGEQFVYSEVSKGNPVYVAASRGGKKDWWKDPLDYYETDVNEIWRRVIASRCPIQFGKLHSTREEFKKNYSDVLRAGRERWWIPERPKWWRYCFDDQGRMIFIHHGRGATNKDIRRWVRFTHERNQRQLGFQK